jgi:hypothetical protein
MGFKKITVKEAHDLFVSKKEIYGHIFDTPDLATGFSTSNKRAAVRDRQFHGLYGSMLKESKTVYFWKWEK